ncbi:hypothetical protein L596_013829 [Steinernema carpocapsae]|uniref:Domain of unknown function DB domain-containing protein n=1 Tax=Steinernema carpocapsae TaxID=34508 RepID=A0A4U5P1C3_STECR|nr:hypothetical protein L596_013829 [Steinernema carpocapsae]
MITMYRISFVFCTLVALGAEIQAAPPSKLVKIACQRNPTLSFCDSVSTSTPSSDETTIATGSEEQQETTDKIVKVNSSTSNEREDDESGKKSGKPVPAEEDLKTLDEETNRSGADVENTTQEILGLKTFEETVMEEKGETPVKVDIPDDPILEEPLPSQNRSDLSSGSDLEKPISQEIPDDPILVEPLPNAVGEESRKERSSSEFGSLLRLPRPPNKKFEESSSEPAQARGSDLLVVPPPLPKREPPPPPAPLSADNNGTVLVFVSKFCVDNRERFVRKCKGEITMNEVKFCKGYPLACQATNNVIPVITYCQRFYRHYDKFCARQAPTGKILDFCNAFDQFCLPETADESEPGSLKGGQPGSALKRCEDVKDQARQVCNPFPPSSDQFNVLRCQQFLKHCKKFVDWQ